MNTGFLPANWIALILAATSPIFAQEAEESGIRIQRTR